MKPRKLRHRFAVASSLGATAMAAVLMLGLGLAQPASAAITIPPYPTVGAYPGWLPANNSVSNIDVSEGSDTTLFVMQSIDDLYSQAGIFPFSCQLASTNQTCLTPAANSGNNPNNTQSDTVDNFAGTSEVVGLNNVGSGNGQNELCGKIGIPSNLTQVDYARSSKPFGVAGCAGQGLGYAKDGVTAVDFQNIIPEAYGTATGYNTIGSFISYDNNTGATVTTPFPSGGIGTVAAGWLPGDPYNCGTTGPACTGTPYTNTENTGVVSGTGLTSDSYRLWCQHGSSLTAQESQIMDWGQLTNLGPTLEVLDVSLNGTTTATITGTFPSTVASGDAITGTDIPSSTTVSSVSGGSLTLSQAASGTATVTVKITTASALLPGQGMPIGVPIRIIGVNGGSGTAATFNNFAKSAQTSGNCTSAPTNGVGGNFNENAASGSNPQTSQGPTGNLEIALENDANQIGDFANANWGATDAPDQAVDIATSLYYMGNGAYLSNANASVANLEVNSGVVTGGLATSFTESQNTANTVQASIATERNNSFPMARTLFNIIRTDQVRASTGGFMNWICDGGLPAGQTSVTINGNAVSPTIAKQRDPISGGNYDTDLTNIINGQYDYSRLSDLTQELGAGVQQTANGVTNLNGTCEANLAIASSGITSGSSTVTMAAAPPSTVQVGWPVYVPTGYTLKIPTGTTVAAINNTVSPYTITLSNPVTTTGSGTAAPGTLYFPGHPPVLAVTDANS